MNWFREIWRSRPPVSPWWMYQWLDDVNGIAGSQWSALPWWRQLLTLAVCVHPNTAILHMSHSAMQVLAVHLAIVHCISLCNSLHRGCRLRPADPP